MRKSDTVIHYNYALHQQCGVGKTFTQMMKGSQKKAWLKTMNCFKAKLNSLRLSSSKIGNRWRVERFRRVCCFGWSPVTKRCPWSLPVVVEVIPKRDDWRQAKEGKQGRMVEGCLLSNLQREFLQYTGIHISSTVKWKVKDLHFGVLIHFWEHIQKL